MKKLAISVKNVSVSYKFLEKRSVRSWNKILKKSNTFEALKNISFDIEEGKIFGIIGKNGSGKSTLLKTIAGVFSPDKGQISLYNNTVSLLSIGIGFNKKLTGIENIYLSGMLLGFSEEEIKSKEKEIIEFAALGDFIYRPVKTYSSGMYSKLAFSITSILETDIILIDEVLSVGDAKFKEKSYNKMKKIISSKTKTVIIVSHALDTIEELCDEVIWLNDGKIKEKGKPKDIISKYKKYMLK